MQILSQDKKSVINFHDVSFSYGSKKVLDNISFSIKSGDTFVIVGQCGFGKSTLLKLCCGLIKPISGTVSINGQNTKELDREELFKMRLDIGYIFQNSALISNMSVANNIALPLKYHTNYTNNKIEQIVKSRISLLQLEGYENAMPSSLSMGLMKRAATARALALMPSLIFYDEPTSGLDPLNASLLNDLISTLHTGFGITSVIVTHDIKSALKVATKIVLISDKKLIFHGAPNELTYSEDKYIKQFLNNI